jgi:hypothetical protein
MVAPELKVNGAWSAHAMGVAKALNTKVMKSPNVNIAPNLYALIITQMVRPVVSMKLTLDLKVV